MLGQAGLVVILTAASYLLGAAIGVPALLPVLNAAGPWWLMVRQLRAGSTRRAIAIMLIWAAAMAVAATWFAWHDPDRSRALVLRSAYRIEMHDWVRTGIGAESTPSTFVPRHLAYAGVFSVAALASGGALAMPMGAILMNQMGDYVGSMAYASANPFASAVLGWHPWAVVRIIGFVILGVVLAGPLLGRILHFEFSIRRERKWIAVAIALLILDIGLKWALAPAWGRLLNGLAKW